MTPWTLTAYPLTPWDPVEWSQAGSTSQREKIQKYIFWLLNIKKLDLQLFLVIIHCVDYNFDDDDDDDDNDDDVDDDDDDGADADG